MDTSTSDYPYLELDIIDFLYNECKDQFLTTDELLDYIKLGFGMEEYNNLKIEAEKRFIYRKNDKGKVNQRFHGHMPIEYVRDIILSSFFLSSNKIDMLNYKYTTTYTLDSRTRKHYTFLSEANDKKERDKNYYVDISDLECIVASNGVTLYGGFSFFAYRYMPSGKRRKFIYSRVYGVGSDLLIAEGYEEPDHYVINTEYTGISGLRNSL